MMFKGSRMEWIVRGDRTFHIETAGILLIFLTVDTGTLWTRNLLYSLTKSAAQSCSSVLRDLKMHFPKPVIAFFARNAQLERFRSAIKVLRNLCRRQNQKRWLKLMGKTSNRFSMPIKTRWTGNRVCFLLFIFNLRCQIVFEASLKCRKNFWLKYFPLFLTFCNEFERGKGIRNLIIENLKDEIFQKVKKFIVHLWKLKKKQKDDSRSQNFESFLYQGFCEATLFYTFAKFPLRRRRR